MYIENHAPDPFSLVLSLHYDFMNYIIFELSESKSESINPIKTICQGFCHFKLKKQKDDFRNKKINFQNFQIFCIIQINLQSGSIKLAGLIAFYEDSSHLFCIKIIYSNQKKHNSSERTKCKTWVWNNFLMQNQNKQMYKLFLRRGVLSDVPR